MSQNEPDITQTVEEGQKILETEQRAMAETMQYPYQQAVELQRNAARFMLTGLDIAESTQRMGVDATRAVFQNFLDVVDQTTRSAAELAGQAGAAMEQPQSTQQQQTAGGQFQAPTGQQYQPQGQQAPMAQGQPYQAPQGQQAPMAQGQQYQPQGQQAPMAQGRQYQPQGQQAPMAHGQQYQPQGQQAPMAQGQQYQAPQGQQYREPAQERPTESQYSRRQREEPQYEQTQ
ncbi:hypothetical protein [Haloarchaeobius sp. HRN-SO-5]|uniref:hypothetical protein n=1 Tax=Haloarchaeobius sp. HRN-SO-5 TaxID=3446118 RepID=UPI003EC00BA9